MGRLICLIIAALAVIWGAQAVMPLGFSQAMNNAGQSDVLAVKNYESGAVLTEQYTGIEQLQRNTQIRTGAYGINSST
ncbi:MAG: hypothetical protein MUE87_03095, partial [Methanothrix sp.]|nr:hypothetical protein [Methanothrix sp.]